MPRVNQKISNNPKGPVRKPTADANDIEPKIYDKIKKEYENLFKKLAE